MPDPSRAEHPPLGVSYVLSYDQNERAFPILAIAHDPNRGDYKAAPIDTPHPQHNAFPNHKLVEIRSTQSDQRVLWIYRILPGPVLTGPTQNGSGVTGTISVQEVRAGTSDATELTGPDVLQSEVTPKDGVVSQKTSRTGVLWSNSGVASEFGIAGIVYESVSDSPSTPDTEGIDVLSVSADPDGPSRWHTREVTIPFSSTTVDFVTVDERGDTPTAEVTWVDPGSTPPTESELSRVQRTLESKSRARQEVSTYSSRAPLVTKDYDEFGGLETATQTIVAPTIIPANTGATVEQLRQTRKKEAELLSILMTTGVIVDEIEKKFDRIPGVRVVVSYYLLLASSSMPADTATLVYERRRHPKNTKLKIEIKTDYSALLALDYNETADMSFPSPTLFHFFYKDNIQGATRLADSGHSVNIPHRVHHTFTTTRQIPNPVQIIEGDYLAFDVPVRGLIDALTVELIKDGVSYFQPIGPTSPSKSTYEGWVGAGTELLVGGKSEIIAAGIYHNEYYYIIAQ